MEGCVVDGVDGRRPGDSTRAGRRRLADERNGQRSCLAGMEAQPPRPEERENTQQRKHTHGRETGPAPRRPKGKNTQAGSEFRSGTVHLGERWGSCARRPARVDEAREEALRLLALLLAHLDAVEHAQRRARAHREPAVRQAAHVRLVGQVAAELGVELLPARRARLARRRRRGICAKGVHP